MNGSGWILAGVLFAVTIGVIVAMRVLARPKAPPVGSYARDFAIARAFLHFAPETPDSVREWVMRLREVDYGLLYSTLRDDLAIHDMGQPRSEHMMEYVLSMVISSPGQEGENYLHGLTIEQQRRFVLAMERA